MREHWREFGFWRWWWRERVPTDAKVLALLLGAALVFAGGLALAWSLPGGASARLAPVPPKVLRVEHVVTVRTPGRVVRRVVTVAERVVVPRSAANARTQTVVTTVPG